MVDDEGFFEYLLMSNMWLIPTTYKITPRPDEGVLKTIADDGIESVILSTSKTPMSLLVNAEDKEYLVIEDKFPNGRPRLEKKGVIFTGKGNCILVERMRN